MNVTTATGGAEVLSIFNETVTHRKLFDLVILEHAMPSMDGIMLAGYLRAYPNFGDTELILSSSIGIRNLPVPLSEIAVDAYFNKPCHRSVLLDSIVDLCGIRSDVDNDEVPTTISLEPRPALGRTLRILVAEDNQVNQLLATRTLEKEGHRVDGVNNGVEAFNAVQKLPYDIVLMDVNMPELDGLQATAQIRALDGNVSQLPIIALTADARKGDRERLIGAGMHD